MYANQIQPAGVEPRTSALNRTLAAMSIDRSAACSGRPIAPRCCLLAIDLAALKTQERNTQDRRMTQHLATLNKILFIEGGFCVINAPKWFSFLAGALP